MPRLLLREWGIQTERESSRCNSEPEKRKPEQERRRGYALSAGRERERERDECKDNKEREREREIIPSEDVGVDALYESERPVIHVL